MSSHVNKRKQQAMDTKERIFLATIKLIKEKGFNNVQMEEIAASANVSIGLFYNYFANKADVLTEAFNYRSRQYYQLMKDEYLVGVKGLEKLRKIIYHVSILRKDTYEKEELRYHHTNLLVKHKRYECVIESSRYLFDMISDALHEAQSIQEIPNNIDLSIIEEAVSLVLRGVTWEYITTEGSYPFEERAWDIVSHYIKGYTNVCC